MINCVNRWGGIRLILNDIMEWIASLPKWQQKLGYSLIEKKSTEKELNEVYETFIKEKIMNQGDSISITPPKAPRFSENSTPTRWVSVGNLRGVNRLKTGPVLQVSEGLTIVYGENGSGKSGYTRLLNNAFISRGDREILPNVYSNSPKSVSADFVFLVDGNPVEFPFPKSKNEFPFLTIRNFDAKSASDDMNRESAIDFAPTELKFFDAFLDACIGIQRRLDEERVSRRRDNPMKYFAEGGEAYEQMKSLSANTRIETIQEKFLISEGEGEAIEKIKTEKAGLIALNIDRQVSLINQVVVGLSSAANKYNRFKEAISGSNIEVYNGQIDLLQKSKVMLELEGMSLFKNENIELIGTDEWKDFIVAAKKYYDDVSQKDLCPLCGHTIEKNDIINKYWKYLESDAENNYKFASECIRHSVDGLKELDISFIAESSVQGQWLEEHFAKDKSFLEDAFKEAEAIRMEIVKCLESGCRIDNVSALDDLNFSALIEKINNYKDGLNQEAVSAKIAECEKQELAFQEKKKVNELLTIIADYVDYLKWDARAEKNKIKTRTITVKQKELFDKYVTDDYLKTFKEECQKLDAGFDIDIVSRGSNAQTLKKLEIKGTPPGKILSEGEQRAIAIANFLTEVQMDSRNCGIVLDDPVCSLDHKRRSRIVERLIEEACCRQVVVFTHEITFFMELKTEAARKGIVFSQETIRNVGNEPGNISMSIPWQGMNVKDRIGKLKNDLQGIRSLYNAGDTEQYYYAAKQWCELLRESWERAVEEILLNDAVQRYNPCVQTQKLKRAPFTTELYTELEEGMTRCSAWCHDQARAINGTIPTIEELNDYIGCFEGYVKQNRKG